MHILPKMLSSCTWQNQICWNLRVWLVAKWACNKMKLLLGLAVRLLQQDEVVAWFSREAACNKKKLLLGLAERLLDDGIK